MVPIANGLDTRAAGALERRDSAEAPAYVHGFGSPTLLVNGLDVAEQTSAHGNACCRLYADPSGALRGAPSVEQIVAALQARPITQTNSSHGIAVEQPQIVVNAIRDVVDQIRGANPQ